MSIPLFPDPQKGYSVVERAATDVPLPPTARSWNSSRYAYFSTIAEGTRYLVQLCTDVHLGRQVCHKSLRPEFASDSVQQQVLLREARVMGLLQHPNVPSVYDISRDKAGKLFFTSSPIVGSTMREMIDFLFDDQGIAMAADLHYAADIVTRVAMTLDFAHTHGVIHRNVSPEKIVSGLFGEVFLLGWECADLAQGKLHPLSPKTDLSLELELTPTVYVAPELRDANLADARSDVFSLGAVLFELLAQQPLAGGYELENMASRVERALNSGVPVSNSVALEAVCLNCIAAEPNRRFQTMHDVVQALNAWRQAQQPDLYSL